MARINPPHRYYGSFEIRENLLEVAGDNVPPHTHPVDHMTYVIRGKARIRLERDGDVGEADGEAGASFYVPAGALHSVVALVDDTRVDCVFAQPSADDHEDHC